MDDVVFRPNTIYYGDCLEVLSKNIPNESVDLIYVDPPFGSGEDYGIVFKDGVEIRHFKDRWIGGKQTYLNWIKPRIRECHRVLKRTGSFYLHCDWHLNAHLRILCDDIFGEASFHNEIIWKRKDAQSFTNRYGVVNDTILFYTKSTEYTWNRIFLPLSKKTADKWYKYVEVAKRDVVNRRGQLIKKGTTQRYNKADISAPGDRTGTLAHYQWKGKWPPKGRHWQHTKDVMERLEREERLIYTKSGMVYEKRFLNESRGTPLATIWTDIPMLRGMGKARKGAEYMGFPTQKPVALLERIVAVSSNPGDLILDPMCGCGTTLEAAEATQESRRNWIGVDISPTACKLMAKRLQRLGVKIKVDAIVGLPRTISEVKQMVQIDPIEFQNWVCEKLAGVSTTPKGRGPKADKNIDGWIMSTIPLQIKGSERIGFAEVQRFETTLRSERAPEGYLIAFSFTKDAYGEAMRARNEDKIPIDLLELEERRIPNPKFLKRPEIYIVLTSKLTKRTWGERKI